MATTVRVYRSTDASAPVLTGQAGSALTVLDACLVNGYGSQAGAGWSKPFANAANVGAYRMAAGTLGGTARMYLNVDDTAGVHCRVRGYETMTAPNTGTGPFPGDWLFPGSLYLFKSITADATARPWILFATERTFYFVTAAGTTIASVVDGNQGSMGFGAFYSYKPGDAYNCFIEGSIATGSNQSRLSSIQTIPSGQVFAAMSGLYLARPYTQIGSGIAVSCQISTITGASTSTAGINFGGAYPDPITGGMKMTRMLIIENDGSGYALERGFMPGCWAPLHNGSSLNFDIIPGTNDLVTRSFLLLVAYATSSAGRILIETTGSWDT